ncbi:flagellar motor control protein ZomB [Gordonia hydrophobica]|uniref:Flagellar motor control protein ZomB n=1 Tax=Gordonia hydrophobica TaxID=40516 RepID=A0ABZ2U4S5_9ACTN|nr:flagellar motor control protein ZomB [Gordonia hydrophobica]MBM7368198.1 arabinofuranosyltransferase [Gordonia hydrophobica]
MPRSDDDSSTPESRDVTDLIPVVGDEPHDSPADADDPRDEVSAAAETTRTNRRRLVVPATSFAIGTIAVTVLFAIGAWQRRWIADDGLIVLRTVRNLLAGNGPVFNAGERVEANTSTLWTYLNWFWAWVTGAEQTEYVALWLALVLSVAALPLAMYGTARLYGRRALGPGITLLAPLGAVVYIVIPPARDFATSGLENGLTLFWVACLWCQLLAWTRRAGAEQTARTRTAFLALTFTAGLAPLIRPEMAVFGGLVLLAMFCTRIGWRMRVAMVVVAGALPVGYQIFRMGYYAVLVPNPAIAKDASGAKWHQGFAYLTNLFGPYTLLLPVIVAVVAGILLAVLAITFREDAADDGDAAERADHEILDAEKSSAAHTLVRVWGRVVDRIQTPGGVVTVVVVSGLFLAVYWLRQGGDFMHGRVLLSPLFVLLLPVMVIPVTIPTSLSTAKARYRLGAGLLLLGGVVTTVWWGVAVNQTVLPNAGMDIGRDGIVDERRFYVTNMGNENPVTAQDYLEYPRMRAMVETIHKVEAEGGGVILPSADYDKWYVSPLPKKLAPGIPRETSVYFLNLGMTSMNAPLDVRVIDQMGLAYPLAAHTARLQDGRIGHDKRLPSEWVVAESGGVSGFPGFIDRDEVKMARAALTCPTTQARFASYKDTWSFTRFRHNLRQAEEFNTYRIAREPKYELLRCGIPMPEGVTTD